MDVVSTDPNSFKSREMSLNGDDSKLRETQERNDTYSRKRATSRNNTTSRPSNDVHEKLYNDRIRREMLKTENEKNFRKAEVRECTFSPKTNKKKIINSKSVDHHSLLYESRKDKDDRLRLLKVEKEERINREYTFEPVLVTNYKLKSTSEDFYERLRNYSYSKNRNMKKIKEEAEQNIPRPKPRLVTSHSTSDLSRNPEDYHRNKKIKIKQIEENMLKEQGITFQPKLNESVLMGVNKSLIERSDDFLKNRSLKLKCMASKDDKECTFSPKLNKNKHLNIEEENLNVGQRLIGYQEKYKKNLEEIKENYKESFPYKPEINSKTHQILKQREIMMQEIKNKYSCDREKEKEKEKENEILYLNLDKNQNLPLKRIVKNISPRAINEESPSDNEEEDLVRRESRDNVSIKCLSSDRYDIRASNELISSKETVIGKDRLLQKKNNNFTLQNVTDSKLLEMANQYITTDESLDKFQAKFKLKSKADSPQNGDQDIIPQAKPVKTQPQTFNSALTPVNKTRKSKSPQNMPLNIKTALDYYKMLES